MPNPIRILTFDVEHGNCHAIWSPSGKLIIIDLGKSQNFSPVAWLKQQKIQTIDLLVLTHPHADHIRGLVDLDGINVKILHRPKNVPSNLIAELEPSLKNKWDYFNSTFTIPVRGEDKFYDTSSPSFDGLSLQLFGGNSDSQNLNNYSIVTVLDYNSFKIIFPGDLESYGWEKLLENSSFKNAVRNTTILMAPHHGREAGWHAELFEYTSSPMLVVISDGSAKETSYTSQYIEKSNGANVKAKNTGEIKTRFVVSTRDNGHVDIDASIQNGNYTYRVAIDKH